MVASVTPAAEAVWRVLEQVPDPEIPVLSVVDLGVVRYVEWCGSAGPRVGLTPTYSGCPATAVIRTMVGDALRRAGYADARVEESLSPTWSSDDLSPAARAKLRSFGIAPPAREVACPRCGSLATRLVSEFGSTPCKAHHCCLACLEPFDRFKCL